MTPPIGLVFDAVDPDRLGRFWLAALGYVQPAPPEGYASWEEYDVANQVPLAKIGFAMRDPEGVRPTIFVQRVPEPKTAKNRLHIDIKASSGTSDAPSPEERIERTVDRLATLGATFLRRSDDPDDYFVVMTDPEGNEFCVV
jgi:hypothetical protein